MENNNLRKKIRRFVIIAALALLASGLFQKEVFAENVNTFSIQPLDENGNVNENGYYHIIDEPRKQRTVSIRVYNLSEEEISVNVTVNPASTNQNGIPSYLGEEAYDSSLIHRMDQLVAIEESELLIPAGSSVLTTLIISLPQEEWEGDILGGIRFTEEKNQQSEQTVTHEVAYTVGILLNRIGGSAVENELSLNEVTASQRNYRNHIEANLQNRAAVIVRNMSIQSSVYREGSGTPIYTYDAHELRMAPNSNFNFGIPTGNQPIEAGDYVLKMQVAADEKEYHFEQSFSITNANARQLNQSAVNLERTTSYMSYGIFVGIGVILVLLVMWWIRRRTRRKKRSKRPIT
ncbi:DUF916 and DUF3324 domain-containing protein [Enterococcus gallinarum]|uniref:DUF916 and DUF3324 domain-containing protein n=1 Tax=Enterococcus gallinarum TaxID=1353 RepID=UPI002F40163A